MIEDVSAAKDCGRWPVTELPAGWRWVPFSEVFSNETTSDKKLAQKNYSDVGTLSVIDQGQSEVAGYTDDETLRHPSQLPVVVFGDHTRCVKFVDFPFVQGADGVKVLRPREVIDARFAFHALRAVELPDKGYSRHYKFLSATMFPVPPLNEQRRIVAKLEALQARSRRAREALDAVPPLLEKLRQSILAAAFRGDLTKDWRAQNHNTEPAFALLARIRTERRKKWEESELAKLKAKGKPPTDDRWKAKYKEPEPVDTTGLPELPEGWCWASLDALTLLAGGLTKGQKRAANVILQDVPYLRVANVQRGHLDLEEIRTIPATEEEIVELRLLPGDILLNEGGDRDKLGRGWVWEGQMATCVHQNHVFRARPVTAELQPKYISHYANQRGQDFFLEQGKQTTNLASVSMSRVRRLPVALPPRREQLELLCLLEKRFATIACVMDRVSKLAEQAEVLNRSSLAKAFRGELVPQDPNDEPAEAMLSRLRAESASEPPRPRGRRSKAAE